MKLPFAVLFALLFLAVPVLAQRNSLDEFEEYARRAEALLDSQPAQATELYRRALAIRPAWVEGWLYLGAALYQQDRFAEGTDAFRKGVALAPGLGTAWAFLGLCEAELDNSEQALADIRKGEQLGLGDNLPFETAVRVKAARLLVQASTFDEALAQLAPLSKKNVTTPQVEEAMGLTSLAVQAPLGPVEEKRRPVVALTGKAAWDTISQRPKEAAEGYRQLMEKYADEPGVRYAHGLFLMETDLTQAMQEFEREIKNTPTHWPALLLLATLQIRQGAPEEGIKSVEAGLKLVPVRFRWLCHAEMGRANLTLDKLDLAVPELEKAARLMPGSAQLHYLLYQAYRRAGRKAEAQKENEIFQKLKATEDPLGVPGSGPPANK